MATPPCPRCQQHDVRPLGRASSRLEWFACQRCSFVWGVPAVEDVPDPAGGQPPDDSS